MEKKEHLMTTTIDRKLHVVGIGGTLREGSTSLLALKKALRAAEEAGATTELLDLRELDLPLYEPGKPLEGCGEERKGSSGGHARRGCAIVEHGRLSRNPRGRHQKRARLRAVPGAGRETLPARQGRGLDLDGRRGYGGGQRDRRDGQRRPRLARGCGPALRTSDAVLEDV